MQSKKIYIKFVTNGKIDGNRKIKHKKLFTRQRNSDILSNENKCCVTLRKCGNNMSDREMVIQLLNKVPDYKIGYVLAYIQGITADEDADDILCNSILQDYLNDKDPDKHDAIPIEEFARQEAIKL